MLCVCAALFAAGCSSAPNAPDTGNSRENTEAADVSGNDTSGSIKIVQSKDAM